MVGCCASQGLILYQYQLAGWRVTYPPGADEPINKNKEYVPQAKTERFDSKKNAKAPTVSTCLSVTVEQLSETRDEFALMSAFRAIFKAILRSTGTDTAIIPPEPKTQGQDTSIQPIKYNDSLPSRSDAKAIRQYIHLGRMTLNTFHGKILVEHQAGHHINEAPELLRAIAKMRDLSVSVEVDRFGVSRIAKVGVGFGTMPKESRSALTLCIETLVFQQCETSLSPLH